MRRRAAAARWKDLIAAAQKAHAELAGDEKDGDRWQKMFVRLLAAGGGWIGEDQGRRLPPSSPMMTPNPVFHVV
jgi:hypothetical protein